MGSHVFADRLQLGRQLLSAWIIFLIFVGVTYQIPAMLLPVLKDEFHVSNYEISWLPALFQLFKGIFCPIGGFAMHMFGSRRCLQGCGLILLAVSLSYQLCTNFVGLAILQSLFGAAYGAGGMSAIVVLMAAWFDENRATAIGFVLTGYSSAGVVVPPLVTRLIEHYGWKRAVWTGPVLLFFIALPLSFFAIRDGPLAQKHCTSIANRVNHRLSIANRIEFIWKLGCPGFHLALISFYVSYIVISLQSTLILYLKTDAGVSWDRCALYSSILFAASIVGKLIVGAGLDSCWRRGVGLLSCLLMVAGSWLTLDFGSWPLHPTSHHLQLLVFAVTYGLGFGSSFTLASAMPAKLFGDMHGFEIVQGFMMLCQVIGGFIGTLLTNKLRTVTGSYTWSFVLLGILSLMNCVQYVMLECKRVSRANSGVSDGEGSNEVCSPSASHVTV
jgi:MFS family permease